MAHYFETVRGVGKDKSEAQRAALDEFLYENGHRHSFRSWDEETLIGRVPPKREVWSEEGGFRVCRTVVDQKAPPSEWLEEWEFVLHTHA